MAEKFNAEKYIQNPAEHAAEDHAGTKIGSIGDLGYSLVDSALAKPYNATVGHVLPKIDLSNNYDHTSIAAKVGDFGGSVVDLMALSKVTKWGVGKALCPTAENSLLASTLSLGTAGALYGGVFTEGSGAQRLKAGTVGFATFSTMSLATGGLSKLGFLGGTGTRTFFQDVALGGLSGLPAGFVNSEANSLLSGRGLVFDRNVATNTLYYGAFGAAMSGASHGLSEAAAPKRFNIPETGNIELGRMMRDTPPADQIALVQQVIASRPGVPMGSWMRLIAAEDMPQFLRASHQMYPNTALNNARYLIETQNLRPPTPDSPPINFKAWQRALDTVASEKR